MRSARVWWALLALCACGGGARPVADPGPSQRTGEANLPLEFDGSTSRGNVTHWSWDFGDGASEAGVKVSHSYAAAGDYSVTLTVRGPGGVDTASVLVTIGAGCTAKAGISVLTADPQPGTPVQFFSAGSAGCNGAPLVQYDWEFGDGATESGPARTTVQHTYAAKGSYVVVLKVLDEGHHEGRASRTLGVGTSTARPVASCPAGVTAVQGRAAAFAASATDPGGASVFTFRWQFSDGGSPVNGATVQHTFATLGQHTAQVVASTPDARESDPCVTPVTVVAPPSYSGQWLLNPAATSLTGCAQFTVSFPAATLNLAHTGASMTAAPAGNGWPAGNNLAGTEDPLPAPPGTFRLSATLPNETRSPCGSVVPDHSVQLNFTSPTTVSGTWRVVFTASCLPGCGATCNCVAQGNFTGVKQ
ncbi:MAG: PKD domain-containing protein [Myxococcaceae bacterium]